VAFLVLIGGTFLLAIDNPVDALARLRGESLTVSPSETKVGDGVLGEERIFTIHLRNHTDRTIRVVGGTTNCGCVATDNLPIDLPPRESRRIDVHMKFSGGLGRFQHRFVLYTDDNQQRVVVARFSGRVIDPPPP
jgi:hypothetical protein